MSEQNDKLRYVGTSPQKDGEVLRLPDTCETHRYLLVSQCGFTPDDAWRALIIVTEIALFQGVTCDERAHEKMGGDLNRINELGCLCCYRPDLFGAIVQEIGTSKDLGKIKKLGEKWVSDFKEKQSEQGMDRVD